MDYINENGKWSIQGNCKCLLEPSESWITENQPPKSDEEKLSEIRLQRNSLLDETDFIIQRHLEQKELVSISLMVSTDLTEEKFQEWLQYRQNLRLLPGNVDLDNPIFPTKPI